MAEDKVVNISPKKIKVTINPEVTPILYTDNINMHANSEGVTLNIIQKVASNESRIVARIGMSREHAKKFVEKLGKLLLKTDVEMVTGKKVTN